MRFWIFGFVLFFLASPAYASFVITEIMYDLEGADTGREWVEIQNAGATVDLTGWKFFEANVNHGLTLVQGNISLPNNGFAVIADNSEKFLLDWPNFSGTIFDSSFSLSNTGETLTLRDANLVDIDSVSYSSDWGAGGDGKSLRKNGNEWTFALPTPGKQNTEITVEQEPTSPYQGGGNERGGSDVSSGSISEPKPSPFQSFAGEDRFALAGAEVYFEGQVKGISDDMVSKVRFFWNFGDGTVGEGRNIKHIFQFPGNYIVNLDVSLGAYSDSDSLKVVVSEASIYVSEIKPDGWIEVKNDSTKISDISDFGLQINDSKIFSFPKDTKLAANSFLTLDSLTLGFEILDEGEIKILYPNGKILFSSKYEAKNLNGKESISFDEEAWVKSEATPGAKNSIKKEPVAASAATPKIISKENYSYSQSKISPPYEGGVPQQQLGEGGQEASVISASFWSEIKWLIFGLGGGVLIGIIYLLLKARFLTKIEQLSP